MEISDVGESLGTCLRRVRRSKDLTQKQLAQLIGISTAQVQKYEKGANRIPADVILRLSQLLSIPVRDFFPAEIDLPEGTGETLDDSITKLFVGLEPSNKIVVADLLRRLRQALSA